jgi:hypothetical protein
MTEGVWLWALLVLAASGRVALWRVLSAAAEPATKVTVLDERFRHAHGMCTTHKDQVADLLAFIKA